MARRDRPSPLMAQLFRPSANLWLLALVGGLVMILCAWAGVGYGLFHSGWHTGQDQVREQPIPFSHAHHVGEIGVDCRYCHASVEDSAFAGMPDSETCMSCHAQLFADSPTLAPVRDSFVRDRPIHWTRVHDLADFVYFNHSVHVHTGVGCETCHGRVDEMPLMRVAAPLGMDWCIDCHRDPGPHLRPRTEIFTMGWRPQGDPEALARSLVRELDVQPRVSCSGCHR